MSLAMRSEFMGYSPILDLISASGSALIYSSCRARASAAGKESDSITSLSPST